MTVAPDHQDDFVITFAPDAKPEEEERFLNELANAIIAIARHLVAKQEAPDGVLQQDTIEF